MRVLVNISVPQANKQRIITDGALPYLLQMIESPSEPVTTGERQGLAVSVHVNAVPALALQSMQSGEKTRSGGV
jgi:hypothetical protein